MIISAFMLNAYTLAVRITRVKSLDLYRIYLIVGGMPRAVLEYVQSGSLLTVPDVQNKIINDYIADMAKYASNTESVKIRAAYNSIPVQLAKENRKFQYKLAQRGGTSTIFGSAIDWLHFAGVVLKCGRIEQGFMPISVYSDLASFKLYERYRFADHEKRHFTADGTVSG